MGYSAYPHLVIGATAKDIFGDYHTETTQMDKYTQLGVKASGKVTVTNKYLIAPNGQRFHVGSNAWNGELNPYGITYRFSRLFEESPDTFIHPSDAESDSLAQVLIGRNIDKNEVGGAHVSHELGGIGHIKNEVYEYLSQNYGYHGEIKIFAQIYHSY